MGWDIDDIDATVAEPRRGVVFEHVDVPGRSATARETWSGSVSRCAGAWRAISSHP
jgi:hypothetical protein